MSSRDFSPSGTFLIPVATSEYGLNATSTLKDSSARDVRAGLAQVRLWLTAQIETGTVSRLRAAGAPGLDVTSDADLAPVLRRALEIAYDPDSGYYGVEEDHGASPVKALGQVAGWVEVAEHLLRKTSDEATAVELPRKLDAVLDEIASWIMHYEDAAFSEAGRGQSATSLPTVATSTPPRQITIGGPGESGVVTISW